MTGGLANSPAQKLPSSHFPKRNVDINSGPQGSGGRRSKDLAVFKLFDDPANAPVIDPFSDGERAVRAAVSNSFDADNARPQAAQTPAEGAALGRGGATVPRSGNGDTPLPENETNQFKGSSSVSRWALLAKIQRLCRPENKQERGPSVCGCGRPGAGATHVNIHLRYGEQTGELRAGVSGIYRCGSPWLCPTCAVSKAFKRAEKVQRVAEATFQRGGMSALVVLTASHSKDMSLASVMDLIQTASSKARKTRAWIKASRTLGILGVICGQEVTYSIDHGWHYHQHLSVLVDGPTAGEIAAADGDVERLRRLVAKRTQAAGDWLAAAYKEKIRAVGGTVSDKHGCKVRVAKDAADASEYTAKGSMAWEVAGGHKDETKAETSLTPWDIADRASGGDKFMYARWKEYQDVMPGTISCRVSAKLSKKLGIPPETDDNENGEQLYDETDDIVGRVEAPIWSRWMRHGLASTFLLRVELEGELGFASAVEQTEADSMEIEREWEAKKAEKTQEEVERKGDRLLRQAANDVRKHRHGAGTRRHIVDVIDRIARDNPGAPRLSAADVLRESETEDENDRVWAELFASTAQGRIAA